MLGATISHYRILEKLGQGGMGEVYLAEDLRLERKVALKFLAPELTRDPQALVRFRNEARAAADLKHPNIATIHDLGEAEGRPFLVFEYVEGRTLREHASNGPLALDEVVRIGKGLASGLAHAHARGIVHRDIKSANIMLTPEGEAKILDFGLARQSDATMMTRPGTVIGTIAYMSPEQVSGKSADQRSDIWSTGVVLYECLTGSVPFNGNGAAVFEQIRSSQAPAPSSLREDIPFEVEHAVLRCLEKDPELRFQHADELLASLRVFETREVDLPSASWGKGHRRPAWSSRLGVAAFLAFIGIAAIWWWPWSPGIEPTHDALPSRFTTPPRLTPLLSSTALESSPVWSPAGNLIAFSATRERTEDIWICDPDGSNPINLTKSPGSRDAFPAWSPDASRIAFFSDRDGPGIYTMTITGGNVRRVCEVDHSLPENDQFVINWPLPDRIIYVDSASQTRYDAYELDLSTLGTRCLTSDIEDGAAMPRVSPDGRFLCFRKPWLGVDVEFSVLDLETGDVHAMPLVGLEAQWSPDSRTLLMISSADGSRDLWAQAIDPDSGAAIGPPRRLTTAFPISGLSMSPDGARAVAARSEHSSNIWSLPTGGTSPVDLDKAEQLTRDESTHIWAQWLHDGTGFIEVSDRRGNVNAWIVDLDSGVYTRVLDRPTYATHSSPDDQWLIVHLVSEDGGFPWVIHRNGSGLRELMPGLRERFPFVVVTDWSADGARIAFHTKDGDEWRFGVMDIDSDARPTGAPEFLPQPGSIPVFSPDGLHLAYQTRRDLFVTDLTGDHVIQVTDNPFDEWITGWESEPSRIYFLNAVTSDTWRQRMGDDLRPVGEAELWFPGNETLMVKQWLDFRDGRALGVLAQEWSDLWLVEFSTPDRPSS